MCCSRSASPSSRTTGPALPARACQREPRCRVSPPRQRPPGPRHRREHRRAPRRRSRREPRRPPCSRGRPPGGPRSRRHRSRCRRARWSRGPCTDPGCCCARRFGSSARLLAPRCRTRCSTGCRSRRRRSPPSPGPARHRDRCAAPDGRRAAPTPLRSPGPSPGWNPGQSPGQSRGRPTPRRWSARMRAPQPPISSLPS